MTPQNPFDVAQDICSLFIGKSTDLVYYLFFGYLHTRIII